MIESKRADLDLQVSRSSQWANTVQMAGLSGAWMGAFESWSIADDKTITW